MKLEIFAQNGRKLSKKLARKFKTSAHDARFIENSRCTQCNYVLYENKPLKLKIFSLYGNIAILAVQTAETNISGLQLAGNDKIIEIIITSV